MGQSYKDCDKITIGLNYPAKSTVLGVAAWMAEQPEEVREIVTLVDRLYTDAKKRSRFAFGGPSWHLDVFTWKENHEFIGWACRTAVRLAGVLQFDLHFKEVDGVVALWFEDETHGGFSINFILK